MFIPKHIIHQILAIFPVIIQNFIAGVGVGWVPPILTRYKDSGGEFSLTAEDCSWIASLHFVGRSVGCLLTAMAVDRVGRCSLCTLNAVLHLLVWTGVALTKNVTFHYILRLVFGLAVGIYDTTAPIYVGENSSPNLRGFFGATLCVMFFAGILVAFVIATYASYMTVAAITLALSLLTLVSTVLMREPAQYLIMKGDESKAQRQFEWLRGTADKANNEFDDLKVKLADLRIQFSMKMFLNKGVTIAWVLNLLATFSGFPAMNALLAFILSPTAGWTVNQLTIVIGLSQIIGVTLSTTIVEQFGRRTLWMLSAILCTATHLSAVALYYFSDAEGQRQPYFAWTIFAIVAIYSTIYAALLLPLSTAARSELLPPQYKAAGVCASILLSSVTAFLVSRMFLVIANAYGIAMNYVFYAFISFLILVYVYFFMPETKGLTLMEIQKVLDGESKN